MKWTEESLYTCFGLVGFFLILQAVLQSFAAQNPCQMPEKQFRIVSLKESPFCPELGLIISLLLLFFHTLDTPVSLIPIILAQNIPQQLI